jgi:uncharacterized protein YcbK (DUF882 family)
MISREEILKGKECPEELEENLLELLIKVNKIRDAFGFPMHVTSGFRDRLDQIRIYSAKGITDESKMHMGSKHFTCQAIDVYDPDHKLQNYVKENIHLMEQIEVWFEDFSNTANWVHIQSVAPASGHRFFKP